MATNEERMRVLRMVDEGKITAEQGAELIAALGGGRLAAAETGVGGTSATLRVVVTDLQSGRVRVNLRLPARLMDLALRLGARFVPHENGVDLEEIVDAVHAGVTGKVVDVTDYESGQRVEVTIE